jgi:CBS domain-containing protein
MGTDDHAFPVLEGDRLVGLVTLQDVRKVPRENWDQVRVREIMTPEDQLVKVAESADASEAVTKLSQRDVRQIPVVRNGNLVGVLRRQDFVRWMQLQSEETGQHIAHIG